VKVQSAQQKIYKSVEKVGFLCSFTCHPETGVTNSCFPRARYSHDPDALCDWQDISFPMFMELFCRLRLTGISVKHPLLITENNSEE